MRRLLRFLGRLLLFFVVLVVLAGGVGWLWLRGATLPQHSGRLALQGLMAPVEVLREPSGVVHLKAQSEEDLVFALGVVHAQDRLWQMEFQRRVGAGRLSEVVGPATVNQDKFLRTWGFYRAAEQAYDSLSPEGKAIVDAYVAGINAYLKTDPPLPLEYRLLGFRPEPWKPADVLVWAKMMAYDLSANWSDELQRYRLLARGIRPERLAQLLPAYPQNGVTILQAADLPPLPKPQPVPAPAPSPPPKPDAATRAQAEALLELARSIPHFMEASNNWVIAGSRTTTGKPLLANDPHLGLGVPSLWYLAHLEAPGYNAIGATLPGLPGVVIGHNDRIAWGVTNVGADVQDLYVLEDSASTGYRYKGRLEPYRIRNEVIKVKGEPDLSLRVRESVYGPVISDVVSDVPGGKPLALRWTALDAQDRLLEAFVGINRAKNWAEFTEALARYSTPSQNFVYADIEGNIGYIAPGKFPIRKAGHSGLTPVPGDGSFDWQGYVPFERWAKVLNPKEGFIVTANNRVLPPGYPNQMSLEWAEPLRAERIRQLILAKEKLSLQDMQAIQQDQYSLLYRDFRPLLQALSALSERAKTWRARLLAWDGNMRPDSVEATVFQTWYTELTRLPAKEVGQEFWDEPRYLLRAMQSGDPNCDQKETEVVEGCLDYAALALDTALDRLGDNPPAWGSVHRAVFDHPILTNSPLARFSDRRVAFGGDRYTVNVGPYNAKTFDQTHGPSYRHIVDLADLNNSRFIHPMGQSGNLLSTQFDDLLPMWQKGAYLPMRTEGYPVRERLLLEPGR